MDDCLEISAWHHEIQADMIVVEIAFGAYIYIALLIQQVILLNKSRTS